MKILMFFHGGSGNRGCEAIVRSAIKVIRSRWSETYIALASINPASDREIEGLDELIFHNQQRGFDRFTMPYFQNLIQTRLLKSKKSSYILMHTDIVSRIDDFDVFLSIGGDNYCYGDLPDYYELDRKIKEKGKKLYLWGASLGKEDVSTKDKLNDLATFDGLLMRESKSFDALQQLGLNNVKLVADGAFVLDKDYLPLPDAWEEDNTIGFNYSPLVFKKHPASRLAALKLLRYILDTTSYKIALTPHVVIAGNDDAVCMQELLEDLKDHPGVGRVFFLPENLNAMQLKGFIARMKLFIGARTHATIAAYSSAVPTMVLGYSIKSLGIAQDLFGEERLVLNSQQIGDADLLIAKFVELERDQIELQEILRKRIPEVQKMSYKAVEFI